ncbi:amidohydrolase [Acanthamoeba castellanii str. Neff]|uniref:Amidohydrolase n=1 Tax=Acanthamoeba castellanii (strain ATCC 30010 / Neff) TaxID=1257118 RepID=L8HI35_ACACF|nr:amidohydrolase [Acanthamoeba castellanii str. Neff]ELR24056.1 amidohydrolase [Acanthamoeba castellanii str. Neff]
MQGIGYHWEMGMLGQGGLTPYQVLYACTLAPAKVLGFGRDLGSLEAGKLADLIVYDAADSPLDDIANSQRVKFVMKDGRMWDAATMDQVLPTAQPLPAGPVLNTPSL